MSEGFLISPQQKNYFLNCKNERNASQLVLKIEGNNDPSAIRSYLRKVVDRHEIFRTKYKNIAGMHLPLQHVGEINIKWEEVELTNVNLDTILFDQLKSYHKNYETSLILAHFIIDRYAKDYWLALTFHPLMADEKGVCNLLEELAQLIFCEDIEDGTNILQYIDYSTWVSELKAGEEAHVANNFWQKRFLYSPELNFPIENNVIPCNDSNIKYIQYKKELCQKFTKTLRNTCKDINLSLEALIGASWMFLSSKICDISGISLGVDVSGRNDQELIKAMGYYEKTLPVCIDVFNFKNLITLAHEFERQIATNNEWSEYFTFPNNWKSENNLGQNIDLGFKYTKLEENFSIKNGQKSISIERYLGLSTRGKLSLVVRDNTNIIFECNYNNNQFNEFFIENIIEQLIFVLQQVFDKPQLELQNYSVIPEEQTPNLIIENRKINQQNNISIPLFKKIENYSLETPNKIALEIEDKSLTYKELNDWANEIADNLILSGVNKGEVIAVFAPRSFELIVGMLAIAKIGAIYLPLDAEYPKDRIDYMINHSRVEQILYSHGLENKLKYLEQNLIKIRRTEHSIRPNPNIDIKQEDKAYLIYTSGSTGLPKGVTVSHRALSLHINSISAIYDVTEKDRSLLFAPLNFDPSLEQIYVALINGATLFIRQDETWSPRELAERIELSKLTVINIPTAYWNIVTEEWSEKKYNSCLSTLRLVICGGDRMLSSSVKQWQKADLDHVRLINAYGPTEAVITATTHDIEQNNTNLQKNIPIGTILPHRKAYILDKNQRILPAGYIGELCLGGEILANGYLNLESETKNRFKEYLYSDNSDRIYLTGDLVYQDTSGVIHFVGRRDSQIKISGYRVELSEIEQIVNSSSEVIEATAVVMSNAGETQLAVFFAAKTSKDVKVKVDQLLRKTLPQYMIPSSIVQLEKLPVTPNGKVDRTNLIKRLSELTADQNESYTPPDTEIERTLISIWNNIFNKDNIGILSDFFTLGGNSLKAMRMISKINNKYGIKLTIKDIYDNKNIKSMAHIIEKYVNNSFSVDSNQKSITKQNITEYPLSYSQERIYFIDTMGEGLNYHMHGFVRINGDLNLEALKSSINHTVKSHESLRTYFKSKGNKIYQKVVDSVPLPFNVEHIRGTDDIDNINKYESHIYNFINNPFDLETPPLIRFILINLGGVKKILGLCMHHIIGDGYSINIILDTISKTYNDLLLNNITEAYPSAIEFKDYAFWQRNYLTDDRLSIDVDYWKLKLQNYSNLNLLTDFARTNNITGQGKRVVFKLNNHEFNKIEKICKNRNITIFNVLIASVHIILQKYTGQNDFCIGVPIANRDLELTENIVGCFINTILFKLDDQCDEVTLGHFIENVQESMLDAQIHKELPFEKLVEAVSPERDLSRNPLFQVMVNYFEDSPKINFTDCKVDLMQPFSSVSKFDLTFDFSRSYEGGLELQIEYSSDLFEGSTIERLASHLHCLMSKIAEEYTTNLQEIDFRLKSEISQFEKITRGKMLNSIDDPLTRFFKHVAENSERTAISCDGKTLNYKELDILSGKISSLLTENGVTKGSYIGLYIDRSFELVASIIAIMKLGAVFVPLDRRNPSDRLKYIVSDSGINKILASKNYNKSLSQLFGTSNVLDVSEVQHLSVNHQLEKLAEEQIAYAIYTSGSTGTPKGVKVSRKNLSNLLSSIQIEPGISKEDRWLAVTTSSFDISILELLLPIYSGAECMVASDAQVEDIYRIKECIESLSPTVLQMTPSSWQILFELGLTIPPGLKALCGGEAMSDNLRDQFIEHNINAWNMYGPTETTIWSSCKKLNKEGLNTIGTPIANTNIYIFNEALTPCPIGVIGEIYIGGSGVSSGYINKTDLNDQVFIDTDYGKLFKTGDLGRWISNNGKIEVQCLGRRDTCVKLRGHRIELSEIESNALNMDPVKEAAALIKGKSNQAQLILYICASTSLNPDYVMKHLRKQLPGYMLPNVIELLDELPKTTSGKIDRNLLQKYSTKNSIKVEQTSQLSEQEKKLSEVWKDILNIANVDREDNFFNLGGNSLSLASLYRKIKTRFSINIELKELFNSSTLKEMSEYIESHRNNIHRSNSIERNSEITSGPLSYAQSRMWHACQMERSCSRYNNVSALELKGNVDINCLSKSINLICEKHDGLRTVFPVDCKGEPTQKILPYSSKEFHVEKNRNISEIAREEGDYVFDLENGPLWRIRLLRITNDSLIMLTNFHHIITDGWSNRLFIKDLSKYYSELTHGISPKIDFSNPTYLDYTIWQNRKSAEYDNKLEFWIENLRDLPDTAKKLQDHPRLQEAPITCGVKKLNIDPKETKEIKNFARNINLSVFMLFEACFNLAIAIETGLDDIVIGTDVANREHPDAEKVIGFFVNQIVLRNKLNLNNTVTDFLENVRINTIDALENQEVPFEKIVNHLNKSRSKNRSPIFQIKMFLDKAIFNQNYFKNIDVKNVEVQIPKPRLDLTFGLLEHDSHFSGEIIYDNKLFRSEKIERLISYFLHALKLIPNSMDLSIKELMASLENSISHEVNRNTKNLINLQASDSIGTRRRETVSMTPDLVSCELPLQEWGPVKISANETGVDLCSWLENNRMTFRELFDNHGSLLFRNFNIREVEQFSKVSEYLIDDLVTDNGEHRAINDSGTVQTPVEYSKSHKLLWHNENTFNALWPSKILFGCHTPSDEGGETPLVDCNAIYEAIPKNMVDKFAKYGVMYVRNYGCEDGVGLGWKTVFSTDSRSVVEEKCREQNIQFEWKPNDRLVTYSIRPAFIKHPISGKFCWVAQIQHWHHSCLDKATRTSLETIHETEDFPRNCFIGNGEVIEDEFVINLLKVYEDIEFVFQWQKGDVLILDNRSIAHGRNEYIGERFLMVSIGDLTSY